jgi:Fic family protein
MLGDLEGHMTTSTYATLAKCSSDTSRRDMQEVVARGILLRNPGGSRSSSYRLGHDASNSNRS